MVSGNHLRLTSIWVSPYIYETLALDRKQVLFLPCSCHVHFYLYYGVLTRIACYFDGVLIVPCFLQTAQGLKNALEKDRVYIKGVRVQKEPSSSTRNTIDRVLPAGTWAGDLRTSRISGQSFSSSLNGSSIEPSKRIGYMVIVDGIPMHIPITEVQKILSKHGAIVQSEMRKDDSGAYSAYLEFEVFTGTILL